MNKKIAITLLALCSAYLIAFYIIKFAFPEWLLLQISSPAIIKFGTFFQKSIWLTHALSYLSTFITFYLFVCAARGKFTLTWYETLYLLVATSLNKVVVQFFPEFAVHTATCIMFILAVLFKGHMLYAVISFTVYGFASQMLLSIRGFETILSTMNVATGIILGIEVWVWLIIFALIFKMREDEYNGMGTTIHRQTNIEIRDGGCESRETTDKGTKRP